jgi:hypothetical protein
MYHTRAVKFPDSMAYGRRGSGTAKAERAILEALANGQRVIATTPRKGGGTHTCTIYPFRNKNFIYPQFALVQDRSGR